MGLNTTTTAEWIHTYTNWIQICKKLHTYMSNICIGISCVIVRTASEINIIHLFKQHIEPNILPPWVAPWCLRDFLHIESCIIHTCGNQHQALAPHRAWTRNGKPWRYDIACKGSRLGLAKYVCKMAWALHNPLYCNMHVWNPDTVVQMSCHAMGHRYMCVGMPFYK